MTKTELNKILKSAGFNTIHRSRNRIVRSRDNKVIKGFPLGETGPFTTTDPVGMSFNSLLRTLQKSGLTITERNDTLVYLAAGAYKVILVVQSVPTYVGVEMDPDYETHYAAVRIEKA